MLIGICDLCERKALVRRPRNMTKLICRRCSDFFRYHNRKGWETCSFCSKVSRVSIRLENGSGVCQNCYRDRFKPKFPCDECNELRVLSTYKKTGKKLCSTCISRYRTADVDNHELCVVCTRKKMVCSRNYEGKPICYSCYNMGHRGFNI